MSKNVFIFDKIMNFGILSKNKAKEFKCLQTKKGRDKFSLFLVEGKKSVLDFLNSFALEYLICTPDWLEKNSDIKKLKEKILLDVDKKHISLISSLSTPPEVIAVFKIPGEDICSTHLEENKFYVLLDNIQDPGNLGTIIRTCDWFGIYDIYASKDTVDVFNPKVIQATMGSLSRVKIRYLDLEVLINENKKLAVYGTFMSGIPINDIELKNGGLILLGNEGNGISERLKEYVTIPVTIPPVNLCNHPDSLNVAIANAIFLSHIKFQ